MGDHRPVGIHILPDPRRTTVAGSGSGARPQFHEPVYSSTGAYFTIGPSQYDSNPGRKGAPVPLPTRFQDLDGVAMPYPYATSHYQDLESPGFLVGAQTGYPLSPFAADKFPGLEVSDFSFHCEAPPPLSSASPPSSPTASRRSTLSSLQADLLPSDRLSATSTGRSRGPSPLRRKNSHELASPLHEEPSGKANININAEALKPHVCLWNDSMPCQSSGFSTREELNWHVKSEHLLLCPVLGCTMSSFGSKEMLDCHIRWAHQETQSQDKRQDLNPSSNLLEKCQLLASGVPKIETRDVQDVSRGTSIADDRSLKMEMSIGISKKRCREQLRSVAEKKARKVASSRIMDSPGGLQARPSKLYEAVGFPIVWEHGVLPFLIEFIPKWCGPGHTITVMRGRKRDCRRICLMTKKPISKARKILIAGHVRDLLPDSYRSTVTFAFSVGHVNRLMTWARGLSKTLPDEIVSPRNPFCYRSPSMGDSIGITFANGDDATATLGPCIAIGGGNFWLANHHPFVEANQTGDPATVEHPSPADRDRCTQEGHEALEEEVDFRLGTLVATSGFNLKTTRITHDPYWEENDKEPPLIVTDWCLISAETRQANLLRKFPATMPSRQEVPITKTSSVVPGVEVCSTGRTSGFQRGQVCEIPAYLDGDHAGNATGKGTREWFIEEPYHSENEDSWIRGGIGLPGDSGAAVVDCETNFLIGQLWGRNSYYGAGPRVTFFTPIFDVFDDIQERCGESTRPQLPQYRDEADRWPVYPICRQCFDLREYMESRRSSRESIMSMIPGHSIGEHDLLSVSELATPNEGGDPSYWVRHAGAEDAGSSFTNVVSPAPIMSTFYYNPHSASPRPGVMEMRSPYALELSDEDLNDSHGHGGIDVSYSGLGKRTMVAPPLVRSSSEQSAKRRRIM
ncbi:hypothetical protein BX600DRAFT_433075 [Xylariales sp. PMI_506]|nr:hypothetical protein BX600DRAFT_433075 [Xylariales sp. PMI_506]